jgi:SAM-dependent methyltransferase
MLNIRAYLSRFYRFKLLGILYKCGIGPFWPSNNKLADHYSSEAYQNHKSDRYNVSDEWKIWIQRVVGKNKKVLDFGCGRGLMGKEMIPYSKRVIGLDFCPEFIRQAKQNLGEANAILGDVMDPPACLPEDFDVVWCVEVIEHVLEPAKLIQAAADHLAGDGRLVLTFPESRYTGKNPEWKNIDRHLWCFDEKGILKLTEAAFSFERCYQNLFWVFKKNEFDP